MTKQFGWPVVPAGQTQNRRIILWKTTFEPQGVYATVSHEPEFRALPNQLDAESAYLEALLKEVIDRMSCQTEESLSRVARFSISHAWQSGSGILTFDLRCTLIYRPHSGHGFRQVLSFKRCEEFFDGLRLVLEALAVRFGGIHDNIGG